MNPQMMEIGKPEENPIWIEEPTTQPVEVPAPSIPAPAPAPAEPVKV